MRFSLTSSEHSFPRWGYALPIVIIAVAGSYLFLKNGQNPGPTITVSPSDFREQVSVSGIVTAAQDVDLGLAANGRIAATYAIVGRRVAAGTVLAETENGDLVAALAQKQAALAAAEANLASLLSGTRPEELAVASATVASAEATLVNAVQSAYTSSDDAVHNRIDAFFTNPRTSPKLSFAIANATLKATVEQDRAGIEPVLADWAFLVGGLTSANAADSAKQAQAYLGKVVTLLADANAAINQGIPDPTTSAATLASYAAMLATGRANVNAAATALTSAAAATDSAGKNLTLLQAGPTSDAVAAERAAVAAAAAEVESARASLEKTRITAPFSGTVTRMDAKVGAIVAPTDTLISMQSDGVFQVETYVPEVSIAGVAVGDPATTTLDAYGSSVVFPAKVIAVDPAETVKDGVPTYKTTLIFLAPDARIRSGMTANVVIETGVLPDAIVIPAGAVGVKDGRPYVSVVKDGAVVARAVETGSSPSLGQVEILSGLATGDVILLTPSP